MFEQPISKKELLLTIIGSTFFLIILIVQTSNDPLQLVFCDVGQGDGIYLALKNDVDVLIDTGPDNQILSCLGTYMPFFDRRIEAVIITHPQLDHYGGLIDIMDRYEIGTIIMSPLYSSNISFKLLLKKIGDQRIPVRFVYAGTTLELPDNIITFYWPTEQFLESQTIVEPQTPNGFRVSYRDPNEFSLIFTLEGTVEKTLFTGDANQEILQRLSNQSKIKSTVLKIPHHGSKNGLSPTFLKLADPMVAVISVGRNNSYGHPSQSILDMLEAANIQVRRTDMEGNIVFRFQ